MTLRKTQRSIRNAEERVMRRQKEEDQQKQGLITTRDEPHTDVDRLDREGEAFEAGLDAMESDAKVIFGQASDINSKSTPSPTANSSEELVVNNDDNEPEAGN